jgi:peptide/nickel transport system ATP-binding protein
VSLLKVSELSIRYPEENEAAVSNLSFAIGPGEAVGLVGESGSGKTQTALAIMGLLPTNAQIAGSIEVAGEELIGTSEKALQKIRARKVAMVFQDPGLSLNPYLRIGDQLKRIICEHDIAKGSNARSRALEMLERVGLPDPQRQMKAWPHQLSGGMRQRVMIAAALIGEPDLLIADEPTTALDVTIQAQILHLLHELKQQLNTAMLLITHDLGVIAGNSERMLVMERGRLIEDGTTTAVFAAPQDATTKKMIEAGGWREPHQKPTVTSETILQANEVAVTFPQRGGWRRKKLNAVLPLSFKLNRGETIAIVGESGSGKTSLARAILGLLPSQHGTVSLFGKKLKSSVSARPRDTLRQLQMVFQDPLGSLNPAMRVASIVGEPLWIHKPQLTTKERSKATAEMMIEVGLDAAMMDRFPHELSGGQAQRVAIARALIAKPAVLVCDEAVAALDNTIKRDILSLLQREQEKTHLSLIFISHDLASVRQISHRVLVLYMGRVVEVGATDELFARPQHPYTRALIDAVPVADPLAAPQRTAISGEVSSLLEPPPGCVFNPRCTYAAEICTESVPDLGGVEVAKVACHRAGELDLS